MRWSLKDITPNGSILSDNEADMVRNVILKDIHVKFPPSDKRFYHTVCSAIKVDLKWGKWGIDEKPTKKLEASIAESKSNCMTALKLSK